MKKTDKTASFMVNVSLFDGIEEEYEEKWQCLSEDSTLDPRSIATAKALYDQEMSFRKWLVKNARNQVYGSVLKIHSPLMAGVYGKFGVSKNKKAVLEPGDPVEIKLPLGESPLSWRPATFVRLHDLRKLSIVAEWVPLFGSGEKVEAVFASINSLDENPYRWRHVGSVVNAPSTISSKRRPPKKKWTPTPPQRALLEHANRHAMILIHRSEIPDVRLLERRGLMVEKKFIKGRLYFAITEAGEKAIG